jgi:hypothetical protein
MEPTPRISNLRFEISDLKFSVLLPCLLITAIGCANVKPTRSGYLSNYDQMAPVPHHRTQEVRPASVVTLADVDSFYIEDVAWRSPRPKAYVQKPHKQEHLLSALRDSLGKELGAVHPIVDHPGPRTARVRAAITDEVNAHVIFNIVMTIIAVPVSNGGATIEAEVVGPAGSQLAAVDVARPGGFFDVFGYYLPEAHAQHACQTAAKRLREALGSPKKSSN